MAQKQGWGSGRAETNTRAVAGREYYCRRNDFVGCDRLIATVAAGDHKPSPLTHAKHPSRAVGGLQGVSERKGLLRPSNNEDALRPMSKQRRNSTRGTQGVNNHGDQAPFGGQGSTPGARMHIHASHSLTPSLPHLQTDKASGGQG
jgi:hypothetical protein